MARTTQIQEPKWLKVLVEEDTINKIQLIALSQYRTLTEQIRLILDEWVEKQK